MSEDIEKVYDDFQKKGYGDGYPIIPPTKARVEKMLEFSDRKPDHSLGLVPPAEYEATVEVVAINAVMAGCKPEYFPVVMTEIEAMLDRPNLRGSLATTGGVWPFGIVNGPIAKEIGLYGSWGVIGTGPFHRANLTIGRTMTLVCQNVGKSVPGISEKKPIWNRNRFGICIAENEDNIPSPWEPMHVDRGFKKETSTVTVFDEMSFGGTDLYHGVGPRASGVFEADMRGAVARINAGARAGYHKGNDALYVCSPGRAKVYTDQGWSKKDLAIYLYENCRSDPREVLNKMLKYYPKEIAENIYKTAIASMPNWMLIGLAPRFNGPEHLWTLVIGGPPPRDLFIVPGHADHPAVIKQIALADGTPAKSVYDFKRK